MPFLKQNVVLRDRRRKLDGFGGSKSEFTWVQESDTLRKYVKFVASAVFCGCCQNVGKACVIRRIAFYMAGAGNPHGCYVLRSKGLSPEKGYIFGIST